MRFPTFTAVLPSDFSSLPYTYTFFGPPARYVRNAVLLWFHRRGDGFNPELLGRRRPAREGCLVHVCHLVVGFGSPREVAWRGWANVLRVASVVLGKLSEYSQTSDC